jgi:ketosteroid isomerase-like protein
VSEEANLALVRGIFERWSADDFSDVGWADPEIEFLTEGPTDAGLHRGIEAMAGAFRSWLDAFDGFGVEPVSFEAAGDAVLAEVRFRGRGKGSGLPLDAMRGANVFAIRNGRVVRLELHIDVDRARRQFLDQT